jgi:hypothetical protein
MSNRRRYKKTNAPTYKSEVNRKNCMSANLADLDRERLYACVDKFCIMGLISERDRREIGCEWVEDSSRGKSIMADTPVNPPILSVTRKCYCLPDSILETLVWHEVAHIVSGIRIHENPIFRRVLKRRRFQLFREFILEFAVAFRIYSRGQ